MYVISTGAMFSSGFFLLPGIAAAQTGPSVSLAYLVAGLLVLPPMLSKAELTTAMPKAGGSYFFIHRAMGPLWGSVGGIGTWLSLVLKSAFALIGMGAYLALFVDVPLKPLAVSLTVAFCLLNIIGAKESSKLQRILVITLLSVLAYFLVQGLFEILAVQDASTTLSEMQPFFTNGLSGFAATVGLVFVSYAGLTKVTSVAEEVVNPDRDIPLGMILSVVTATAVYCVGVFIMVAILDPSEFRRDMTPVATAADAFFDWIPAGGGLIIVVVAAVAAFASTGNAGIMSASRYPMAMARDELVPMRLAKIGRFSTPTLSILLTSALMIVVIIAFDVAVVAKLASAFQLVIFGIINVCVIVMRESRLEFYHPTFKSPFYPWTQVIGVIIPIWLIVEMGWMPAVFSAAVMILSVVWYRFYTRGKEGQRGAAIFHVFEKLGRKRDDAIDRELRGIMAEKGLSEDDPFERVVALAPVIDTKEQITLSGVIDKVIDALVTEAEVDKDELKEAFLAESQMGLMPLSGGVAAPNLRHHYIMEQRMVIVRCREGVDIDLKGSFGHYELEQPIQAFFFLVSPEKAVGRHLRILAEVTNRVDDDDFIEKWLAVKTHDRLRQLILRDERFLHLRLLHNTEAGGRFVGRKVRELSLPTGLLVALIRRRKDTFVPTPDDSLEYGDRITVIGNPDCISTLKEELHIDE